MFLDFCENVLEKNKISLDKWLDFRRENIKKNKSKLFLRNKDFFDVENHKEAILMFNERVALNNGVYEVTGTLTIKDISNPVKFTLIPSNLAPKTRLRL